MFINFFLFIGIKLIYCKIYNNVYTLFNQSSWTFHRGWRSDNNIVNQKQVIILMKLKK